MTLKNCVAVVIFLLLFSCSKQDTIEIALIPKGTDILFWKSVHAGGEKAADELGINVIWQGPQKESDREQQINIVQNFISRGVDAICLAPLDEVALMRPVKSAKKRNIPVVIIDSGLQGEDFASFVATDNWKCGHLAAEKLTEMLDGQGNVLLLRFNEGSNSTHNREEGFLEWMQNNAPGINLISTDQYAGVTKESALQVSQNLLNRFSEINGIFCPNESTSFGMLRALQIAGKAGKVKLIGFDYIDPFAEAIRKKEMHGLVVQDPFSIGYIGVQTAYAVLEGKSVEPRIETQVVFVTPENIDNPDIQNVVNPDIKSWLGEE